MENSCLSVHWLVVVCDAALCVVTGVLPKCGMATLLRCAAMNQSLCTVSGNKITRGHLIALCLMISRLGHLQLVLIEFSTKDT